MDDVHPDDEDILCFCQWLTREQVIEAIPLVRNVKELKQMTLVCTVCFGCEADLEDLLAEYGHLFGTGLRG